MSEKCKICAAGEMGKIWTNDIADGKRTVEDAATFFDVGIEAVDIHIVEHIGEDDEEVTPLDMVNEEYFLEEMMALIKTLKDYVSYLIEYGEVDRNTIADLTKLSKELRETLRTVVDIQNKRDKNKTEIDIKKMEKKVNEIQSLVLTQICDECRPKVLSKITTHLKAGKYE